MIFLGFVDRGHIAVCRVAHLVRGCGFDELPESTAHRGTTVNDKESGPVSAGHRHEKLLRFAAKKQYGNLRFFILRLWTLEPVVRYHPAVSIGNPTH